MARTWTEEEKAAHGEKVKAAWARRKATADDGGEGAETDSLRPERAPDPRPKTQAKPKKRHKRVDSGELEGSVAKIFSAPAVPAKMLLHCDYCAGHFAEEGPRTAHELVALSETHPALRNFLEDLHRSYTSITWVGIIGGYVAKPIAHHLAPNELLAFSEPVLGVPPREKASQNGSSPIPSIQDIVAMPYDQVLKMAQDLGITTPGAADAEQEEPADSASGAGEADPDPFPGL